jgi:type II secretory pathway component PulC
MKILLLLAVASTFSHASFAHAADSAEQAVQKAQTPYSYSCESKKGKGHLIYRGDIVEWESENKMGTHVRNPDPSECVSPELRGKVQSYVIWGVSDQTLLLFVDNGAAEGAAKITTRQMIDRKKKCSLQIEFHCAKDASVPKPPPSEMEAPTN